MTQQESEELETEVIEVESVDDVTLRPGPNADDFADVEQYISAEIRELYDVFSYRHYAKIDFRLE